MKRSEALKEIGNTLKALRMCEPDYSDENISRHILARLEQIGMLPPRAKLGALGIEDNAWEPEDGEN